MKRCRGFTVMEVLITLSLLATAAAVGGRLFVISMNTLSRNEELANIQAAADHCGQLLRRDIWSATESVDVTGNQFAVTAGDGTTVNWSILDSKLCRKSGSSTQQWPADGLRFTSHSAGVALCNASGKPLRVFIAPLQTIEARP